MGAETRNAFNQPYRAGIGTGSYTPSGVLTHYSDATGVGNGADQTEDTVWQYTLPGGSLLNNFGGLRVTLYSACAATADTKTLKFYFGATSITINNATTAPNNQAISSIVLVTRLTATTQLMVKEHTVLGTTVQSVGQASPAETLASDILLKITVQNGTASNANALQIRDVLVELLPL